MKIIQDHTLSKEMPYLFDFWRFLLYWVSQLVGIVDWCNSITDGLLLLLTHLLALRYAWRALRKKDK